MKVCIPSTDRKVSRNFGKASEFLLITVNGGKVASAEVVPNPGREKVKVPLFVAGLGVTHVIAGGIGNPAIGVLKGEGVQVISGAEGPVDAALGRYFGGMLESKKMSCAGENKCGLQHPKS
jgi:predicted Fe-Mo cluster-binding NifX family protein